MSRRSPKGQFGASILNGLIEVEIDMPVGLALQLDADKIARVAGNRAARTIRGRMRKGLDGDTPAHQPEDGSKPFKVSGSLMRSVRFDKTTGTVKPDSRRSRANPSKRVRTNYQLMMVHLAAGRWTDPMGSESKTQQAQILKDIETELAKQLDKGALRMKGPSRTGRRGGRKR